MLTSLRLKHARDSEIVCLQSWDTDYVQNLEGGQEVKSSCLSTLTELNGSSVRCSVIVSCTVSKEKIIVILFILEINNSPLLEMWTQQTDNCSSELEVRKKALLQKQTTTVKETGF